jgi:hypothetical protein
MVDGQRAAALDLRASFYESATVEPKPGPQSVIFAAARRTFTANSLNRHEFHKRHVILRKFPDYPQPVCL